MNDEPSIEECSWNWNYVDQGDAGSRPRNYCKENRTRRCTVMNDKLSIDECLTLLSTNDGKSAEEQAQLIDRLCELRAAERKTIESLVANVRTFIEENKKLAKIATELYAMTKGATTRTCPCGRRLVFVKHEDGSMSIRNV